MLAPAPINTMPSSRSGSRLSCVLARSLAQARHVGTGAAPAARGAVPDASASAVDAAAMELLLLHDVAALEVFDQLGEFRVGQSPDIKRDFQLGRCVSFEHCVSPFSVHGTASRSAARMRGCVASLFLVPSSPRDRHGSPEGSGAPKGAWVFLGTLRRRVPCHRHARLPALHRWRLSARDRSSGAGQTSITSPRSRRHLRRPSVRPVQPLKAAPILRQARAVVRDDPGLCLRNYSDPGATPCSAK